jgi:GT2 family glycosyltransferase
VKILRHESNKGAGAARNTGSGVATGEILVFIDSDTTIYPDTLDRIKKDFENNPEIGVVQGIYSDFTDNTQITQFANYHNHYYGLKNPNKYLDTLATYCVAIKKSVFDEAGGFETDEEGKTIKGEDQLLGYQISYMGSKILLDKDLRVDHHHPFIIRRFFFHTLGCGRIETHLMLRNSHDFLKKSIKTGNVGVLIPLKTIFTTILAFVVFVSFLALFIPFYPVVSITAFCVSVFLFYAINSPFLLFIMKKRGFIFFLKSLFFLYMMFLATSLGCAKGAFEKIVLRKDV